MAGPKGGRQEAWSTELFCHSRVSGNDDIVVLNRLVIKILRVVRLCEEEPAFC